MSGSDKLTMTFTRDEWRMIVVGLKTAPTLRNGTVKDHADAMALRIAEETGNEHK